MKKKKNNEMKENSFIQGAFIATLGIVISKILGIIYVIPFYAIVGSQGGALYGYAYNIYSLFLSISQAGLPLAVSKIISEYQTLGYYDAKKRAFEIAKKLIMFLAVVSFLILVIFADGFASLIIGDVVGGNSVEDVAKVIRIISGAVLIVPLLSVSRGYLQGHKFITPTSRAQIIEQVIRVTFIVFGSYFAINVLKLDLTTGVGIALFAATIGALVSYIYLVNIMRKNKTQLEKEIIVVDEPKITNKEILNKLLVYAFPFIMIGLSNTLYNSIDIVTLIKHLVNSFNYEAVQAEAIMSVISTWGHKLNMIVASINTGILVSLIPHLTSSLTKNDTKEISKKINQSLQIIFYLIIPMVVGLSILAQPVWTVFYGYESAISYGAEAYRYYSYIALGSALYISTITTVLVLKEYKAVLILIILGLLLKGSFNYPLLYAFNQMGLPTYYGAFTATILGDVVPAIIALIYLNKKFKINYSITFEKLLNILISVLMMTLGLFVLRFFVSLDNPSRIINVLIIALYTFVGASIYFFLTFKNKVITDIFGEATIKKITNKFKRKG